MGMPRNVLNRTFSVALMVTGLGWASYLLIPTLSNPSRFIPEYGIWLALATLLLAASLATNVLIFHLFLRMQEGERYPLNLVAKLHLVGQLLRYLPGRIWGVAYQMGAASGHIPAVRIARANLDMMLFFLVGNTAVALLILGVRQGWSPLALLLAASLALILIGFLFLGGTNWLMRLSANIIPNRLASLLHALSETKSDPSLLLLIFGLFCLVWSLYLAAWHLLGKAYTSFSEVDFLVLSAYYTLAATVGILSTVTPAGLGVREAIFIMLAATSAEKSIVAFFAIFGRVWLMTVEFSLLLIPAGMLLLGRGAKDPARRSPHDTDH